MRMFWNLHESSMHVVRVFPDENTFSNCVEQCCLGLHCWAVHFHRLPGGRLDACSQVADNSRG